MRPYPYLRQRQKKKRQWTTYLLVFLMIASVGGFIAGSHAAASERFKGVKFTQGDNYVRASINGIAYNFNYLPSDVDEYNVDPAIGNSIRNTHMIYISYDPTSFDADDLAAVQYNLFQSLEFYQGLYVQAALTTNNSFNLPIISCANATGTVPVVVFAETNRTGLYFEDGCISAEYSDYNDIGVLRDLIVYAQAGILP